MAFGDRAAPPSFRPTVGLCASSAAVGGDALSAGRIDLLQTERHDRRPKAEVYTTNTT